MENKDYIEVHIEGNVGNDQLTLDNYSIEELKSMLDVIIKLSPSNKKGECLSLRLEDGSVKQRFTGSKQRIALFSTLITLLAGNTYLEDIEPSTAEAVEVIQKSAKQHGYTYTITTNNSTDELKISPLTNYGRKVAEWADGDFYLYGEVVLTGGVEPKLHIDTKEYGRLTISADKEFLSNANNLLYHTCGMLVKGRQNIRTNEINKDGLMLVEVIKDYTPTMDMDHLHHCIQRATAEWGGAAGYEEWYNLTRG